ncbi:hypothetical protein [Adhaeribacter rhizoryzae]|uniref:DUF349 domain-containing protein n=1 Tax=Adhaeribacter rhizoryzae TaxID=2607907 RepID=A0A5M6DJL8_9BACT|nr:hypothetical protein [Adhaeribacter rhizoryzae]KAA5546452.1 hypothetical protein F0145_11210 [Adhaeribacter rhizoryzae]
MKKLAIWSYSLALSAVILACESRTTTQTTTTTDGNDTTTVTRRTTKASDELEEFRGWVKNKADRTDSAARENWPEVKEDFKRRTARLDSKADSLSAEARAEYNRLKAEYQIWEEKNAQRASQPLDPNKLRQWEQELLGPTKELTTLTAADMRETYLLFMGIVRAKKNKWTQDDWDYVDNVYARLNDRKEELEGGLSTADRLKIKSLQAEYLALEATHDAKDLYQHVRK